MKKFILHAVILSGFLCSCHPSTKEIQAVQNFDPERYMGKWYEIARLPQWFERNMDYVTASYSLNGDGTVKVVNQGIRQGEAKQTEGVARLKNADAQPATGELSVSFFRPFYADYRIIELAPDYSCAVVTGSGKDSLWILARQPQIPQKNLQEILDRLQKQGFEIRNLEYPKQNVNAE